MPDLTAELKSAGGGLWKAITGEDSREWWLFVGVGIAGAVGGAGAVLYASYLQGDASGSYRAPCVLGVFAAVIGVYVVAHTDRKDAARALAFALLCGLCWKPVLEAGQGLVDKSRDAPVLKKARAELAAAAGKIAQASASPTQGVQAASDLAAAAVLIGQVRDQGARADLHRDVLLAAAKLKQAQPQLDSGIWEQLGNATPGSGDSSPPTNVDQLTKAFQRLEEQWKRVKVRNTQPDPGGVVHGGPGGVVRSDRGAEGAVSPASAN